MGSISSLKSLIRVVLLSQPTGEVLTTTWLQLWIPSHEGTTTPQPPSLSRSPATLTLTDESFSAAVAGSIIAAAVCLHADGAPTHHKCCASRSVFNETVRSASDRDELNAVSVLFQRRPHQRTRLLGFAVEYKAASRQQWQPPASVWSWVWRVTYQRGRSSTYLSIHPASFSSDYNYLQWEWSSHTDALLCLSVVTCCNPGHLLSFVTGSSLFPSHDFSSLPQPAILPSYSRCLVYNR